MAINEQAERVPPRLDMATIDELYDELARRCDGSLVLVADASIEVLTERRGRQDEGAVSVH